MLVDHEGPQGDASRDVQQHQDLKRINIVPGSIECEGSSYELIRDPDDYPNPCFGFKTRDLDWQFSKASLGVTQRLDRLEVHFSLLGPSYKDSPREMRPADLVGFAMDLMRRAHCPNNPKKCQGQGIVIRTREKAPLPGAAGLNRALFEWTKPSSLSDDGTVPSKSEHVSTWVILWHASQLTNLEVVALMAHNNSRTIIISEGQCELCSFRALIPSLTFDNSHDSSGGQAGEELDSMILFM